MEQTSSSISYVPVTSHFASDITGKFVKTRKSVFVELLKSLGIFLILAVSVVSVFIFFVIYIYYPATIQPKYLQQRKVLFRESCRRISDNLKFDCFPRGPVNREECERRGCCWSPPSTSHFVSLPWCYYPENFTSYQIINRTIFDRGEVLLLNLTRTSPYPNNIKTVKMTISRETKSRLRIRILDNDNFRYEPPYPEVPVLGPFTTDTDYKILVNEDNFGFAVIRKTTGTIIFNTSVGGFTFADQFLQLSARIPSKFIYGLGERRNNFLLNTDWEEITLFNTDSPPLDNTNLYGTHPFYLCMEEKGISHGVFLLNSNAMDIILQPAPAITYRTIGGIFDFYFFLGPSPADVVQQYTEVIGFPFMPPYWSLGFHLSRFGLHSLNETVKFWSRNKETGIPFDVQWNDIDYMDNYNDFTISSRFDGLSKFVEQLHNENMKYVIILDPGVASREPRGTYPPYDRGISPNIFIKNSSYLPLEGKVWNAGGGTVFPDFTDPKTTPYWLQLTSELYEKIKYDGLWLDMNEISNFVDGSLYGCESANNTLDNPPYVPNILGGYLNHLTVCMSGKQFVSSHYDVHNLYGFAESIITSFCLATIRSKRPFLLSRSTFAGSGKYTAHWTGDVFSRWDDMKHSVGDIMSFNLFGIPMVGADICGFNENTTKELCQRWSQLGAFYPFSRNHNDNSTKEQDPASFDAEFVESTKKALNIRYKFLPYLYTLLWNAHKFGETVIRPLFFEFPKDTNTYTQNTQFFWGPALLIVPVLTENATSVTSYFPKCVWFDAYTLEWHESPGDYITISAPLDKIPLYFRAGFIIPYQQPGLTTVESRRNPFGLYVALDEDGRASGSLFWDDGETFEYDRNQNNLLQFRCEGNSLTGLPVNWGYDETAMMLYSVDIMGLASEIYYISVNAQNHTNFTYVPEKRVLSVWGANINLRIPFNITWM